MSDEKQRLEEEIEKLTSEIEDFKQEKERVRAIVGRIGGVPMFNRKLFEIVFVVALIACLALSLLLSAETTEMLLLDIAVALVSLKLLYMIRNQARVSHFQLWVLSSIEWRLNEISKQVKNNNSGANGSKTAADSPLEQDARSGSSSYSSV